MHDPSKSPGNGIAHDHDQWESVALAAFERTQQRQARMVEEYGLLGDVQYFWSMDDLTMTFSRQGKEFLRGRITMVASVNTRYGTWLWSWANESLPPQVLGEIAEVRRHGEANGYPLLVWPSFKADQKAVAQVRALAADLLGAEGIWRSVNGDQELYFLLHDLHRLAPTG